MKACYSMMNTRSEHPKASVIRCAKTVRCNGEKVSLCMEAVKRTQMLYETSVGLLQGDLRRGKNPTLTIFNTLNWKRSEMLTVYIDFEVIPETNSSK